MKIRIKKPAQLILASILSTTLVACGGGGGSDSAEDDTSASSGLVITNSNYEAAFKTGVAGSFEVALRLMFSGNDVDVNDLTLMSSTSSTRTYSCDNQGGTLQITALSSDTNEVVFDDCQVSSFGSSSHYQGITTVKTVVNSGSLNDIGSYNSDWDITQTISFNNYIETSPAVNGMSRRANGNMILESSNNLSDAVNQSAMRSMNLTIDLTDVSNVTTTYSFSDIYYDLQEDIDTEYLQSDIDFTATITGIGNVDLITTTPLEFDDIGTLLSGEGHVTTGASSAKMVATGSDNIAISLDPENDETYESPIVTTWSAIGGSDGDDD